MEERITLSNSLLTRRCGKAKRKSLLGCIPWNPFASGAGAVFTSGRIAELSEQFARRMASPTLIREEKSRTRSFAPRVSPLAVGTCLAAVLRHAFLGEAVRPTAPWLDTRSK